MKGTRLWSYERFLPATTADGGIYICRVEPRTAAIELDYKPAVAGILTYLVRGSGERKTLAVSGGHAVISGLTDGIDYEFFITAGQRRSDKRIARPGEYPDKVVNYIHPQDGIYAFSGRYIGSPSITRLPDGALLASHDVFVGDGAQNFTVIFRSEDNGASWYHTCDVVPCFWGKLFTHGGEVYLLGTSCEYGDLLIGKSSDGGRSFCAPAVLARGSGNKFVGGIHKAPVPVIRDGGRIWSAVEFGSWNVPALLNAAVVSADENADLLDPESWSITAPATAREGCGVALPASFLEGSVTVLPDGRLVDIMRNNCQQLGKTVCFEVDRAHPEAAMKPCETFDCDFHVTKFEVRRDPVSGRYYAVANRFTCPQTSGMRTLQCLMVSEDALHWHCGAVLHDYTDRDWQQVGLQYADFEFDGEDIICLTRTAINGANNFHDANCITYSVIKNFRQYL